MNQQNKICKNCKSDFTIEPEDFAFYAKINVPAPTFCPDCRTIRRMQWRNERALYKRKCDVPNHNEEVISVYHKDSPIKVYDQKYWWSDAWDPIDYGKDYDWNKPFFEQFGELITDIPTPNLNNKNNINSHFVNWSYNIKNCYLSFALHDVENCIYCSMIPYTKDSIDCLLTRNSNLCYLTIYCQNSYKLFYSYNCDSCTDSYFLYDCKNCFYCFDSSKDLENLKFGFYAIDKVKDSYDVTFCGVNSELCYDVISCVGSKCLFVVFTLNVYNIQYSFNCHNCNNLFGCIGLRNKEYCILNKQYTKEEYEKLVPKIIEHMG